ncbi:phage major capsid protein [Streptomyces acidiscabies]|uniref:Phage major capsid protein n=1 Tax=Streptomyces acidiscabies TaxID=42234 RepID=A0AAP6BLW4_9ACTN|nr:phage major capsid protein [Streptomyces acidiscabies]MBZ3918195.1 phage major capsid protein [Streptomyces acidiscabies]MDX2967123.1 phage major capsid protein [Streptomyces acidiscabies]MDX3016738.1 phage major capsid protein [Streptomyces acidiscabies]MDX3788354.1 phage major capsid protein [Streptomyces acidiscabies]
MTLAELIAQARTALDTAITARQQEQDALMALRSDDSLTEEAVTARVATRDAADAEVTRRQNALDALEAEQVREDEVAALQARTVPGARRAPAYDQVYRVGQDERTYRPDQDQRGQQFQFDVRAAFLGDYEARDRLVRHMHEERVERGQQIRAVGTGAFAGLVIPQYLTDLYAPLARTNRPFADACRPHILPPTGMTVEISRVTTGSSVDNQANQNDAVAEQDMDDTQLSVPVRTAAGQQTASRQSIERGAGVEDVILDDLFRAYGSRLDTTMLNVATVGLTNVATAVAYTDGTPTTAELYPKLIEGLAGMEAALLDMASGDNLAVMHSRRWYWMQNAMGTSYPLITQPGVVAQTLGANYAEAYGRGVRGILPNGTPVIVDNNIATNLGAGTNEDEIYLVDRQECHLWEDPDAPVYIRAEQPKAANLGVQMVVYGYYAFTFQRQPHARKIAGTGLVTPTFTGA